MSSLKPQFLDRIVYTEEHLKTIGFLRECKGEQERFAHQTPEMLETLKTAAVIESTESSNRLEGIIAERSRIKALALHSTNPANRPEQEIAGYRDALALIHERLYSCYLLAVMYQEEPTAVRNQA